MLDLPSIGGRIKQARKENGFTREGFSEKVGVSPHYIYEIERGMKAMSLETLTNIAAALELSTDYILFGKYHAPDDDIFGLLEELSDDRRARAEKAFAAILPYIR